MSLSDLLNSRNNDKNPAATATYARAYIRVSHERSAEKAISPETQRRRLEACAKERGYIIKEWYTELAKSAFRDEYQRTEFLRMIEDSKADPETSVIRYDRFSRSWSAPGQQEDLLRHGVRIESAEEGYYDPDSETGAIMMPLTWGLNRLFSIKLRNVVIPNMKTNFEQRDQETGWAYKNGGYAQFGYKAQRVYLGKGRKSRDIYKQIWVLNDTEVAGKPVWQWVKTMLLDWRLRERLGYDSIAARLTELGIPTSTGRTAWSHTSIQSLIGDMSRLFQYAGFAFWNREDCTDRNNRKQRDPSEWVVVENAHPAIITEEECEAILAMTQGRQKPKSGRKGAESRFALSGGLLKCKHCGSNFAGIKRRSGDYYVCGSHLYRRGAGCGPAWNIPRKKIEELVFSKILRYLSMDDDALNTWVGSLNDELHEQWEMHKRTSPDRKKRIKALEKKQSNLAKAIADTGPVAELVQQVNDNKAALERLHNVEDIEEPGYISVEDVREYRDKVQDAAVSEDESLRARIIKNLVKEIIVDSENKTLEGKMIDPRAFVYISVAAPRGHCGNVYNLSQLTKLVRFESKWLRRKFRAA